MPWSWSAWAWVSSTASSRADAGVEQLLAQIGRGIDQHAAPRFDQQRAAAAPVARVGRIAASPIRADRRHPRGGAAAEHGHFHAGQARRAGLGEQPEEIVAWSPRPARSGSMPLSAATAAAVAATKAGSLRLPRYGTGAR